jgi:hypothetical protein
VFILDATALAALIDSYEPMFAVWHRADAEQVALGIPATSVVEAAEHTGIAASAWDAILWSPTITVLPLGQAAAVHLGTWSGTLAARHSLWESMQLGWPILTRDDRLYAPDAHVLKI